jgi:hypothetical protein
VKRWVDRYLAGEPMHDQSSRLRTSPNRTTKAVTKRCVKLRIRLREGPVLIAARLGIAPSTVHRVLTAARLNRLSHVDRATSEPIRRYEHPHPGSLVHMDVKKLGNIPDGGGWRYVGRRQGSRNRAGTPDARGATLRRHLVNVPARIARHGHGHLTISPPSRTLALAARPPDHVPAHGSYVI